MELLKLLELLDARTPKIYRGGSARSVAPEETWSRIQPLLGSCGITRVANVTGLDHVGIPVYQAIRPNSRSLSVSQGKGSDRIGAKVSAVMEAIELHYAERPTCLLRRATFAELRREGRPVADPETLPHTNDYDASKPILWTMGVDIVSREETWVPFDLVHVNLTEAPGSSLMVTSNGLASGNNLAEAVFHGLCEVIERDAAALFALRPAALRDTLLDLEIDRITHVGVRALLTRLHEAELTPVAWNMTSDVGLPAVRVYLFDTRADAELNPISAPYGAGCHADGATAIIRALTESAQTRVGWIAGSRDDLSRDAYRFAQAASLDLADFIDAAPTSRIEDLPTHDTPTVEEDLAHVLSTLRAVGIDQVIVVPLAHVDDAMPVAIARVIVPGLEAPNEPDTTPGARARAVLAR